MFLTHMIYPMFLGGECTKQSLTAMLYTLIHSMYIDVTTYGIAMYVPIRTIYVKLTFNGQHVCVSTVKI